MLASVIAWHVAVLFVESEGVLAGGRVAVLVDEVSERRRELLLGKLSLREHQLVRIQDGYGERGKAQIGHAERLTNEILSALDFLADQFENLVERRQVFGLLLRRHPECARQHALEHRLAAAEQAPLAAARALHNVVDGQRGLVGDVMATNGARHHTELVAEERGELEGGLALRRIARHELGGGGSRRRRRVLVRPDDDRCRVGEALAAAEVERGHRLAALYLLGGARVAARHVHLLHILDVAVVESPARLLREVRDGNCYQNWHNHLVVAKTKQPYFQQQF